MQMAEPTRSLRRGWIGVTLVIAMLACGCGHSYHLPGHHADNLCAPPDVMLREGEKVRAISTGAFSDFNIVGELAMQSMFSADTNVVDVQWEDDSETVVLFAVAPGTTIVKYDWCEADDGILHTPDDEQNIGFRITVVPAE
jgi:hypothetical protein